MFGSCFRMLVVIFVTDFKNLVSLSVVKLYSCVTLAWGKCTCLPCPMPGRGALDLRGDSNGTGDWAVSALHLLLISLVAFV